jgi:hypothetical protein
MEMSIMDKVTVKLFIVTMVSGTMIASGFAEEASNRIDRKAIVSRNDIVYTKPEVKAPISVGNGKFVFTVDPTGLQTFPESYNKLYWR